MLVQKCIFAKCTRLACLLREGLQCEAPTMPRFKIWQNVQRPNLSDNGPIKVINLPPKIITFPQKCDLIPSISDHFPRNHFDPPKYVDLRAFYWLSRVAFTHFLSRNPPVCQECGVGVKPILAMPGFWQHLTLQPLPKLCEFIFLSNIAFFPNRIGFGLEFFSGL